MWNGWPGLAWDELGPKSGCQFGLNYRWPWVKAGIFPGATIKWIIGASEHRRLSMMKFSESPGGMVSTTACTLGNVGSGSGCTCCDLLKDGVSSHTVALHDHKNLSHGRTRWRFITTASGTLRSIMGLRASAGMSHPMDMRLNIISDGSN
uniref:Uncharacterized protein n=1 Tax=Oryza sativa subsp. japonica TaxID=39947 RepID=Q6ZG66_ORYSJ|nr:hypothetical protein [Oryza sativa Japonica Group]